MQNASAYSPSRAPSAAAARDRRRARRRTAPASQSMRAPRTTMPCSVSATLCRTISPSPARQVAEALSMVGWMIVWVSARSSARELVLVRDQVRRALVVAVAAPVVGAPGEAGEGDVHVVGRAPHQPDRQLGRPPQRSGDAGRGRRAERGIMWLTLIGSPVSGSRHRQSSAASCCRSKTAARLARRRRRPGAR